MLANPWHCSVLYAEVQWAYYTLSCLGRLYILWTCGNLAKKSCSAVIRRSYISSGE